MQEIHFHIASDSDCERNGRISSGGSQANYGLRRADLVAQTSGRRNCCARPCNRGDVISMMGNRHAVAAVEKDIDVLWVSNLRALKRPELALELARQLPQVNFSFVGGPMPRGETYYEDVRAAAARLPNVKMHGAVRYADSGTLFDRAKLFLNTSSIEGFPNTFLQAWIRGVPVVTFFDPDALVKRMALGRHLFGRAEMREAIRSLLEDASDRQQIGRRARDFATREYTTGVAARYLELLNQKSPQKRLGANQWAKGADLP